MPLLQYPDTNIASTKEWLQATKDISISAFDSDTRATQSESTNQTRAREKGQPRKYYSVDVDDFQ